MFSSSRLRARALSLGLVACLAAVPARAADIDKYLPADTETILTLNVRQILDSELVKKFGGVEQLRAVLNSEEQVATTLKDLGLDPLKDFDRLIVAGPASGEQDRGLMIVHGRFNVEKLRAAAEKAAKDNKEMVEVLKKKDGAGGEHTVYKVTLQEVPTPLYVGFASPTTILVAPSLDYLIDGLKVKDQTKVALKNKAFEDLLTKLDDKQSLSLALVGDALTKGQLADAPIKESLKKIDAIAGGITLTDGIKLQVAVSAKTAEDAKALNRSISDGLNTGIATLALLAMQNPQMQPVVDIIKKVETSVKDKVVTIKGEVSGETLEKLKDLGQ